MDATNPPDSVLKWLEQDRYYRWCTYVFIPIQYAGLVLACWLWSSGDLSIARQPRPRVHDRRRRRDRDQHRPRARPQARRARSVAEPRRPRPDRLRPLLHRAQPRPPRPRRHPRGPGQLAAGGELLGLPAAHRLRQPAPRPGGSRRARLDRVGKSHWSWHNDILSAWAMTSSCSPSLAVVFGPVVLPYLLLQAVLGFSLLEVVNYLEHYGLLRAASARTGATSAACPSTAGTATTSPPTCCSTTCSATATTTPTRPAATRRCATSTRRRSCPPATPG